MTIASTFSRFAIRRFAKRSQPIREIRRKRPRAVTSSGAEHSVTRVVSGTQTQKNMKQRVGYGLGQVFATYLARKTDCTVPPLWRSRSGGETLPNPIVVHFYEDDSGGFGLGLWPRLLHHLNAIGPGDLVDPIRRLVRSGLVYGCPEVDDRVGLRSRNRCLRIGLLATRPHERHQRHSSPFHHALHYGAHAPASSREPAHQSLRNRPTTDPPAALPFVAPCAPHRLVDVCHHLRVRTVDPVAPRPARSSLSNVELVLKTWAVFLLLKLPDSILRSHGFAPVHDHGLGARLGALHELEHDEERAEHEGDWSHDLNEDRRAGERRDRAAAVLALVSLSKDALGALGTLPFLGHTGRDCTTDAGRRPSPHGDSGGLANKSAGVGGCHA